MRNDDMIKGVILLIVILIIGANINEINSFLSFKNEQTVDFGHSKTIVPNSWNLTDQSNESKTSSAITNGYISVEHWDDWPEDHITLVSHAHLSEMEPGGYKVVKNESVILNGVNVSKQYFKNPSRDSYEVWTPFGVNYVFAKEGTNYCIQVHYFTHQDYKNATFLKYLDTFVEEDINNIHNKEFSGVSTALSNITSGLSG